MKEKIKRIQEQLDNLYKDLGMFMYKGEITFNSYHIAKALGSTNSRIHK